MNTLPTSFSDKLVSCIAVVFVSAGLWMLINAGISGWHWWRTRGQVQVEARVLSVEKAGGPKSKRTDARFAYEFGGQSYTSDKVTLFFSGSRRWYDPLAEALQNHQTIRVYIDPSDPRLAVIDREFRFWPFAGGMVFVSFFLTSGLFVLRHQWRLKKIPHFLK